MLYLDTCAAVKLYVDEVFSTEMRALVRDQPVVLCHDIGYVEMRAALAMAERLQRIDTEAHALIRERFERHWLRFSRIGVDEALLMRAADLAEGFALRAYDSLHLAAADRVFRSLPNQFLFVSFDRALCRSAHLLGMRLPEFVPLH